MYKALDIAHWFISRTQSDYDSGISDELITNLKLQKLLYYAQGCTLALTGQPLFEEDFRAWEHGPVITDIYHTYKSNGKCGIFASNDYNISCIDIETGNILESVYNEFGQFSASKLRNMTHNETPWIETNKNDIISKNSMKEYFKNKYIIQEFNEAYNEYLESGKKSRPIEKLWEELNI